VLGASEVAGVVFTGPPRDPESHLRAVSVSGAGAVNWSPGGTAMSAIMSVLDAMQLLPEESDVRAGRTLW
jgi:proline racemase